MKRTHIEFSNSDWSRIAEALASYVHTEYNCAGSYCKREIGLADIISEKIGEPSPAERLEIP